MTAREMIQQLKADGWEELKGKKTGHRQFKHPVKPGKVTVPMHPGDIPPKTVINICKQAGLPIPGKKTSPSS